MAIKFEESNEVMKAADDTLEKISDFCSYRKLERAQQTMDAFETETGRASGCDHLRC